MLCLSIKYIVDLILISTLDIIECAMYSGLSGQVHVMYSNAKAPSDLPEVGRLQTQLQSLSND